MNDLNEQILFFNDICFEDSYLNEDSSSNSLIPYNKQNTSLDKQNQAQVPAKNNNLQKVKPRYNTRQITTKASNSDIQHYVEPQPKPKDTTVDLEYGKDWEYVDKKEEDKKEDKREEQKQLPQPPQQQNTELSFSFEPKLDLLLSVGKYKIININDNIKISNSDNIEITGISFTNALCENVFCCPYFDIPFSKIAAEIENITNTETDAQKIENEIKNIGEKYQEKANLLLFVFGRGPIEDAPILGRFVVEYKIKGSEETKTIEYKEEIGNINVRNTKIVDLKLNIPDTEKYISFDKSLNLIDYLYVKFEGEKKFVKYTEIEDAIKSANRLSWSIAEEYVKNIISLNANGVLSIDKSHSESFTKLINEQTGDETLNGLVITVGVHIQEEKSVSDQAEILITKNPSAAEDFIISDSDNADNKLSTDNIAEQTDARFIAYPGIAGKFYTHVFPTTAKPEYYYITCSVKDKSPIVVKTINENKEFEYLIPEDVDLEKLTAKQKQIEVKLTHRKADNSKVLMNGSIIKYVYLDVLALPKDLDIAFDSSSALQLQYDSDNSKESTISYAELLSSVKVFNNKELISLSQDYPNLNNKIQIGFAVEDPSVAVIADGALVTKGEGKTTLYAYLISSIGKESISESQVTNTTTLPKALSELTNVVAFDEKEIVVDGIIREFKIDIPPKPKAYDLIMAPVVGGKAGKVFGIRHYVVDPQREINETNDRATSLLNKANPVKFFSDVIKKYSTYKASNISNKKAKRADNAQEPSRENRIMSNTKVNKDFNDRNAHTWKESVEFEEILKQYGYLTEATTNKLDWQEDLEKCTTYFKEVYNQYITSLNIIYGDNTENFASAIKEEFIKQFQIKITGKNPLHDYNVCQAILRSAAGQLGRKNDNIAAYKKLGEELDAFAEDTNKTMIDRIEAAFASLFTGKVKDGSEKTRIPMDQSYLKNLWFGYYRKLKRDAVKFQQKFLNSDAFMYARKVHNTTIPDILSLCLACIAMIVEQHLQELDLKEIKDYDWALLFNVSLNKVEAEGQSNLRELQKEKQVYADRWNEALRQSKTALEHSVIWKGSAFERKLNGADIDKLYKFATDPSNTCTYDLAPNTGISKVISEINKVVAKASMTNPNINALQNELNDVCNKIIWATIK